MSNDIDGECLDPLPPFCFRLSVVCGDQLQNKIIVDALCARIGVAGGGELRYEVGKEVEKEGGQEGRTSKKEGAKWEEESKEIAKREGKRSGGKRTEGDWRQQAAEKKKALGNQ